MKALYVLWKFSRPHTVIGSTVSILMLYAIACGHSDLIGHIPLLVIAILTGISCNIFIVGINQIEDVAIDKINKPYLPIASGELSISNAYSIIYTCMFISIVCSAYISFYLLGIVALSLFIGAAYSLPPLYFKKHHLPAALAITIVRGLLVNLGAFYVFTAHIYGTGFISNDVWFLSIFIMAFSVVIAWFKDLTDMTGDARYNIKTFAILYSAKAAFYTGTILVVMAYLSNIYFNFKMLERSSCLSKNRYTLLIEGHVFLLILFLVNAFVVNLKSNISVKKFYKRFWLFFFAEYV